MNITCMYKKTTLIICIVLFITIFIGCDTIRPVISAQSEEGAVSLETEQEMAAPETQPTTTYAPSGDATSLFSQLDADLFSALSTSSGYRLHQTGVKPDVYSTYGDTLPMTFGIYSADQKKSIAEDCAAYLERLYEIDRSQLSAAQQIAYDTMEQQLILTSQSGEFLCYDEPLDVVGGIHVQLPVLLMEFQLNNAQDIESYFELITSVPDYFEQILVYERERASWGLFMTQDALDLVVGDCRAVIQSMEKQMLTDAFQNAISRIDGLAKDQARAYKTSLSDALENVLIPAYTTLIEGLEPLRATCRSSEGIYASGATGLSYYEYRLKAEASADMSVEDALLTLEDEMYALLLAQQQLIAENPKLADLKSAPFTTGHVANDIAFAKETSELLFGMLPEHTLNMEEYPEQLVDKIVPSTLSCTLPQDTRQIFVLYNKARGTDLFFWARRLYPGTLCRTLYQKTLPDISLTQRAVELTGYSDGWAAYAEKVLIANQTKYDASYYLMQHYSAVLKENILPAIGSILVNYYGNDLSELEAYYNATIGSLSPEEIKNYFTMAIDTPFACTSSALGYCLTDQIFSSVQDALGDNYNVAQTVLQYLSLGPAFYNILQEQMDVWSDAQMPE